MESEISVKKEKSVDVLSTIIKNEPESSRSGNESNVFGFNIPSDIQLILENIPEALSFIETLQLYIKKQALKIKKLKSKLKRHSNKLKKNKLCDKETQTCEECLPTVPKTISEEITEAAHSALNTNGFVYEATSGMYYDYNTGYYYNDELRLYYDGNTGTYYSYDAETQTYVFHSKVDVAPNPNLNTKRKKKQKSIQGKKTRTLSNEQQTTRDKPDLEDGECSDSSQNSEELNDSDDSNSSSTKNCCDIAKAYPPCMRILITESSVAANKPGTLFMITFEGGTLGREGDHSILLPDINVSKHHLKFTFSKESDKYYVTDMGSRNGTILNGKRMSVAKQESEQSEIVHGSVIQISGTKLLCHIHAGNETCGHCEPGLFQENKVEAIVCEPVPSVHPSKNSLHKTELKRIKKKFGIEHIEPSVKLAKGYADRAKTRRDTVGSSAENAKTEVASVNESISSENKGFKMLSKMGWSEGQSLGKDDTGLKEPIPLQCNPGTSGLGSVNIPSKPTESTTSRVSERKQVVWRKTQQRYNQIQPTSLSAFDDIENLEDI